MKKIIKKFYFLLLKYINPKVDKNTDKLTHYGTKYGGYDIVDNQKIFNVISCGLGEDASFDIEIINAKNCKVIAVDPTPRAATHFKTIMENVGNSRKTDYSNDGFQENSAYNLEKINKRNYKLIDSAVFDKSKKQIKLFFPKNENHVSASLDLTNKYSENFFFANCISIKEILNKFEISSLDVLKLDVEGAEIHIIKDILDDRIFPNQLLVEYTHIRSINFFQHLKIFFIHRSLKKVGYKLIKINEKGDFTYLLKNN